MDSDLIGDFLKSPLEYLVELGMETCERSYEEVGDFIVERGGPEGQRLTERPPGEQTPVFHSIDSVNKYVDSSKETTALYIGREFIEVFRDPELPWNRGVLNLRKSPSFELLQRATTGWKVSQVEFLRLLRTTWRNSITANDGDNSSVKTIFSKVDFKAWREASGTVSRGNEALGKQTIRKCANADDLPESLVWSDSISLLSELKNVKPSVRIYVEFDFDNDGFELLADPVEFEEAEQALSSRVFEQLHQDVDKYFGRLT